MRVSRISGLKSQQHTATLQGKYCEGEAYFVVGVFPTMRDSLLRQFGEALDLERKLPPSVFAVTDWKSGQSLSMSHQTMKRIRWEEALW